MGYFLSFRFVFWLLVGGAVTWYLLRRKGRDPWFGAVLCGLVGGLGGIFLLAWIWLWMYYMMPAAMGEVVRYRPVNSPTTRRWKIRW